MSAGGGTRRYKGTRTRAPREASAPERVRDTTIRAANTGRVGLMTRADEGADDLLRERLTIAAEVKAALNDAAEGKLAPRVGEGVSKQWYHPTLWGYWKIRSSRGVK